MALLLFIVYTVLFCWLIHRMAFFRIEGLSSRLLILLFLYRIAIAMAGCYVSLHVFEVSDSVVFHHLGLEEFKLLLHSPGEYLVNIFQDPYHQHYAGVFDISHSYWNNLRTNLLAKILSLFDLFSLGSFYVNTLLFNFLVFFGVVALYKAFNHFFPNRRKLLILFIFLFPTTVYFTAAIHKDGLIFMALGVIIYQTYRIFYTYQKGWHFLWLMLMALLIFLMRNFVFMALIPGMAAWLISKKEPKYSAVAYSVIFAACILIFFVSANLFPSSLNFPQIVAERQHAFIGLGGDSFLKSPMLQPDFMSFARFFPIALDHIFLRPYVTDFTLLKYIPFIFETLFLLLLFLAWVIFPKKIENKPVFYFFFFFSVSILLAIGYTIPNLGALVRYKSPYSLFLMVLLAYHINWFKIKQLMH